MRTAKTKEGFLEGSSIQLKCCLCGNLNLEDLIVQEIGIAVGMSGENYSFCEKCWNSKDLGKNILILVGYENGMLIKEDMLEIKEILP